MSGKPHVGHRRQRDDFPLRGLLRCSCGRIVTGSVSRGEYGVGYAYYHCASRCVRARADAVHASFDRLLGESSVYRPLVEQMRQHVREQVEERTEAARAVERDAVAELDRLRRRRERLLDAYLGGALNKQAFADKDGDLDVRIRLAQEQVSHRSDWATGLERALGIVVVLLSDPRALWRRMNLDQRQRFVRALYGDGLMLDRSGQVTDTHQAGVLRALPDPAKFDPDEVARPRSDWTKLLELVATVTDLAA
jgi:hypothetical protein